MDNNTQQHDGVSRGDHRMSMGSVSNSSLYSLDIASQPPAAGAEGEEVAFSPSWGDIVASSSTFLATRSGAPTVFTKHLDAEAGKFYYFNHETQESTWDAPVEDIPLFFSEEQKESIRQFYEAAEAEKADERQRREKALASITRDHRAARVRQEAEAKAKLDRESKHEWTRALLVAARENSDCNMSWTNIVRIDPSLYTFEKDYGRRLRSLQLVGVKLTSLPDQVGHSLPGLETLNISNNLLTTLPDAVVHLTSLTRLSVLGNRLESLPDRIGLLCSLKRIELSNNKLRYLPDSFAALTQMERLDLESNCIRLLPENLHYMSRLVSINVNRNELIRIPRCLHRLRSLKSFSANNNILSYITSLVCKSKSIEELRLCRNRITILPERIGELVSLRELALDFNSLSYLPMSFYMLTNLTTLRVEGNPALASPTDEVITMGARAVVQWCKKRFLSDENSRMRKIIHAMQKTLEHIGARRLEDPAFYDDSYIWKEEPCFAVDLDYFFETAVPLMNSVWNKELISADKKLQKRLLENTDEKMTLQRDNTLVVQSFPYLRREVMWAITNYFDAIGPVYMQTDACFRRCICVDESGNRKPCVPPKKGYMCRKRAAILKKAIILQGEKEERLWFKQKKAMILEAEVRAEAEAVRYLESNEGKLWVTELSYSRSEAFLEEKKIDNLVARRKLIAEGKIEALTKTFERKKRGIQDNLERKLAMLHKDISEAKNTIRTTPEGYIKEEASKRLITLSHDINELPEFDTLKKLQDDYVVKCQVIEDEILAEPEEAGNEDQLQEDGANFFDQVDEVLEKAAKEAAEKEELVRSIRTVTAEKKGVSSVGDKQMTDRERKRTAEKERQERERQRRQKAWERLARWKKRQTDKLKFKITHGFRDFIEGLSKRMDHAKLILNGEFSEVQKELEYHIYQEYINDAVTRARRQAEEECHKMDRIRSQWGDLGLEETFLRWKQYVKATRSARRKDLRRKHRLAMRNYTSGMLSVHLAEAQLSLWKKCSDIYSDVPYWKHSTSGAISWEEPKLESYVPPDFVFPEPPEALAEWVGENTTTDESSEGEGDSVTDLSDVSHESTQRKSSKSKPKSSRDEEEIKVLKLKGKSLKKQVSSSPKKGRRRRKRIKTPQPDITEQMNPDQSNIIFPLEEGAGSARSMASTFESESSGDESDDYSSSKRTRDDEEEKSDGSRDIETASYIGSIGTGNFSTGVALSPNNLHVEVPDATGPLDTLPGLVNRTDFGMDGDFAPRRWPLRNEEKVAVFQDSRLNQSRVVSGAHILQNSSSSIASHVPGQKVTSILHSPMGDVEVIASPFNKLRELQVVIPESNSLAIPIRSGAGRKQVISESYSYGPDSLRAGRIPGRVGRPLFQQEAEETDEERSLRLLKKSSEAKSIGHESISSMLSSLSSEQELNEIEAEVRARQQVSQYHEVDHLAPYKQQNKLMEIHAQNRYRAHSEAERAMLTIQHRQSHVPLVRRETYMKQRNRRPRTQQGMFDPRIRKSEVVADTTPKKTIDLLRLAGGTLESIQTTTMENLTNIAQRAINLKNQIKAEAAKVSDQPKKSSFFRDHIDVIVRENYEGSSESENSADEGEAADKFDSTRDIAHPSNASRFPAGEANSLRSNLKSSGSAAGGSRTGGDAASVSSRSESRQSVSFKLPPIAESQK